MIISIKSSAAGGASNRGLVHYLAHSKLDQAKEGIERREFFGESENKLDVRAANRHLSLDKTKPKSEELLHIVVAPSREEIESLGENNGTRREALKVIVRETVAELQKQVKAQHLKWVAVAHFNTDHPHAHLAVQKQFVNKNGKIENLHITRQMLHYNERDANGAKILHKGALISAAENKIKELAKQQQIERETGKNAEPKKVDSESITNTPEIKQPSPSENSKIPHYRERRILAEEMITAAEIARRERNIENLIEHGDKKCFKIKDEKTGTVRRVSLFDIEQKIEATARRQAFSAHPRNAEKRAEFSLSAANSMRVEHVPTIRQLETIRRHVLGFENRHLTLEKEKYTRLHNQKLLLEKKYERLKTSGPLPLFNPDELQELQSEAVKEQNTEKILRLETIRQSNAAELNLPTRRDEDMRELSAAKIIANLKTLCAEKKLREFSANKDLVKVKIGDSFLSHHELRRQKLQTDRKNDWWTIVKSKTGKFLFHSNEKYLRAGKPDYPALHQAVAGELEKLETGHRDEIKQQQKFNKALDQIFDTETNPHKTKPAPAFSAFELAQAEDLARDAGHAGFYENSLLLQETLLRENLTEKTGQKSELNKYRATNKIKIQKILSSNEETLTEFPLPADRDSAEKIIGNFVSGRAEARLLLAEIKMNESEEIFAQYLRNKFFIKHRISDPQTGDIRELSLRETEPRNRYYFLDRILEKIFESKEQKRQREAVREVSQKKQSELQQNLIKAQNQVSNLKIQKTLMLEKYSVEQEILPLFTPKEIVALETRASRTNTESEAARLEKIIKAAEKDGRIGKLQDLLEDAAKDLETLVPDLMKNREPNILRESAPPRTRQMINENRKISNQSPDLEPGNGERIKSIAIEPPKHENPVVKEKGRTR